MGVHSLLGFAADCPATAYGAAAPGARVGRAPTLAPLHGSAALASHANQQRLACACLQGDRVHTACDLGPKGFLTWG